MFVDVEAGPNIDRYFSMLFRELEPPREVVSLQYLLNGEEVPVRVTGWDHETNQPCPACACKVEESGDGVALLIFGGTGGLRFKHWEDDRPWDPRAEGQWSETHLVYPRNAPVVYAD